MARVPLAPLPTEEPRGSPAAAEFGEREIVCPITGEIYEPADVDGLIDCYERCDAADKQLYSVKLAIRHALAAQVVDCQSKTRYVQGKRRKAKLTMPDESWEQSILKEAWFSFPDLAATYLRLDRVMPKMREVQKLFKTSGNQAVEAFRDMIMRAKREPSGEPSLKVEE